MSIVENSVSTTRINIKPLTVNKAWAGRRFKTPAYKAYETAVMWALPKIYIPDGKLKITIEYYFSTTLADIDNPGKCLIDIMQKRYGFNDRDIYEMVLRKHIVKKGDEGFEFKIESYE